MSAFGTEKIEAGKKAKQTVKQRVDLKGNHRSVVSSSSLANAAPGHISPAHTPSL